MTRVLAVCTGNVCRSPVTEILLRAHWAGDPNLLVSSAGIRALVGETIHPPIRKVLLDWNLPDEPFAAVQVTPEILAAADLVLVMTRQHRASVVSLHPPAVRRTFTLLEFARIAPLVAPSLAPGPLSQRLAALVPKAARARGRAWATADDDAITDPYDRGAAACRATVDRIQAAVAGIVAAVATPDVESAPNYVE